MDTNTEEKREAASRQLVGAVVALVILQGIVLGGAFVMLGTLSESLANTLIIPVLLVGGVPIVFLMRRLSALETAFWKEVAQLHGYTYVHRPYFEESALVFQQGHSRATGHGLMGTVHDRPFRFFQYHYTVGHGKHPQTHTYCIFEVAFAGTFPHVYLNNTRNRDLSSIKGFFLPRIPLPHELEKDFNLHGPKQYEIEVLEIFTPDLLLHLLDTKWEHDLELVDQKLYVFREQPVRTKQEFEHELGRLEELLALLAPKLNRMKLTPIGDHKTTL